MPLDFEKVDFGGFGINQDEVETQSDTNIRSNMDEAFKINPDQHAKNRQLSRDSGIPEYAVTPAPEEVEHSLKLDQVDFASMVDKSPQTAKFLGDFDNAVVAQDDISVLQEIENVLRSVPSGFVQQFGMAFEGGARTLEAGGRLTARGFDAILPEAADRFIYETEDTPELLKFIAKAAPSGVLRFEGEGLKLAAEAIGPEGDEKNIATDIAAGVGQVGGQILSVLLAPTTGLASLFAQGVDQQAERQELTGTEGQDVTSDLALLTGGGVTAISERVGIDKLLSRVPPKIKNKVLRQLADLTQAGGVEALQEVVEGVAHGLIEQFTTNPDADVFEGLDREAITAGGVGVIVRGIVNAATPGKASTVISDDEQRQLRSETEQRKLDQLNGLAKEANVKNLDNEAFKQFVASTDANDTTVFIDAVQASLYLQEKTPAEIEADPALQLLADQVREASVLGGEVTMPVEDFAATMADTEHFDALRESMTMSDDTIAPFRQDQVAEETQNYMMSLLEEANENVSQFVEAQDIYNTVRTQLIDSGQVTAENASVMAQIVPAWATVHAQKQGISIEQAYADSGLTIEGPQTGERARLEGELEVLEQAKDSGFEGDSAIEAAEFVAAVDKGLDISQEARLQRAEEMGFDTETTLFHGTMEDISEFDVGRAPVGRAGAIFLSEDSDFASAFAGNIAGIQEGGNVIPVIMSLKNPMEVPLRAGEYANPQIETLMVNEAKRLGHDGILFTSPGKEPIHVVFDPSQIRSVNAAFDPEFSESADLLAQTQVREPRVSAFRDAPLLFESARDKFLDVLPEDAEADEVIEAAEEFGPEYRNFIKALERDDWLGFDFPSQAISAALSEEIDSFEASPGLKRSIGRMVNVEIDAGGVFRQKDAPTAETTRGYYDPANSIIRLTESADLSTFLHEFAHFMYEMELNADSDTVQSINNWYKRNAAAVATEANSFIDGQFDPLIQGDKPKGKKVEINDLDVINFLDNKTSGSKNKDAAIRRAVHEQFARGFETYLMEGKAPSIELRNAFKTFARWITQIYNKVRGGLDVNLDDEMREVFNRLIATDEQIAAAEARARFEPMFTDAAMAGMTGKEFTEYQKRQEKVKDKQTETLRDKLIAQLTRQTKKWWKEEKADIIDEEIGKLKTEQVYATGERLRAPATDEQPGIKLDHAATKAIIGEQKTNKLGRTSTVISGKLRGMTVKGGTGVHPDEAAAFFGYSSGAEMLTDIVSAPPIKEAATDNAEAIMTERHGDILTDGTIEQQADEAVQNEERGKLILAELKALSRGTNQPTIDRGVIKQLAEDNISKLSFRNIHPGKYRKAEIRAAQESAAALATGDKEAASRAKARQALNYYLGMAATNAKNETTKIVDRMARYNKKKVREEIQKAGNEYWEQITRVLERFEFRKSATLTQVDQVNQDINSWMRERVEVDGDQLVLTNAVLNETYITHWKNVPFGDLKGINESVKNMEHVARYSNKITRLQDEVDFKKLVGDWTAHMESATDDKFTPYASTADDAAAGRTNGRWLMAQMTKIPFLASWLDGGERAGLSHEILVQPFTDAYNEEIQLWDEVGSVVMEAIQGRDKADIKRHNTKVFIPAIQGAGGHSGTLMGHEILAVALNTGNAGNLRKMLLGEGWADPDVEASISFDNPKLQAVLEHMTKSDWELVQLIWSQMDVLFPRLAEVHRKTTGLTPPKVEATPVVTPFGTFEGGYYPVKYDPNRSAKAQENDDRLNAQTESMFAGGASLQASVNTGATNERTGYYAPMRLSLDVVQSHFQETIHYITHHDAVRETNKLIRDPSVRDMITKKLGPQEYAQLKPWLNDIAKDGRESPTKTYIDAAFNKLRMGTTLGVMGFKASTGIIQISGLSNSIAELGLAPVLQSMRLILGSKQSMMDAWDFAVENSKVLEHRPKTMDREIKNAMKQIEGNRGFLATAQEASMKHIALIQTYMVDLPTWHAAYIKEMSDSGDEAKAFARADWTIENVQGSGATKDLPMLLRNQSKTHTTFTMFMTFFSSLWNLERDLVKGAKSGAYSKSSVAAKAMFLFTLPVLFEMIMRGELGGDDEEPEAQLQKMLTGVALYPVQSIPFVRDVASGLISDFGYNSSPVASVLEQGLQALPKIAKGVYTDDEITKAQIKAGSKLLGAAIGVPGVNQTWATGEHLYDVMAEGEEFTTHQLLFGPKRE